MRVKIDDSLGGKIDGLQTELDSALHLLAEMCSGAMSVERAAWWLCANHRHLVAGIGGSMHEAILANAAKHGPPPRGPRDWRVWVNK